MEPTLGLPKFLPRWLCFGVFWILLSVLFASQAYWSGYAPWPEALWLEAAHWLSWGIVSPLVFWLCRRLYRGERTWTRYAAGLLLGAIVISLLQPALTQLFIFLSDGVRWLLSVADAPPRSFLPTLHVAAVKVAGYNLPIYAGLILAWHAMTYYTQLRDRQVKAMELESLLHQAQLQTLRSQLNPHFLFNTLHSIAELVHRNPTLAEQLILRLGELLRQVLRSSTEQEVALAEELDFVKGYVEIEQMRLGERLQVTWEIAPEALAVKVPSLILQPLIENAILHGVAATTRAGVLAIRAACDHGYLHLQVRDTGPGLPQAGKAQVGIGLSNTQTRLRRLYGSGQRFELLNDNGLVVNIQIPLAAPALEAAT
ncbi:ATPase [Steroidobacter agaridevorans]|uniref:ATPase n=1 Tax=Steroidobacter agaridevorans TaxID=2695856 RepID=A0A829YH10_9GAMM|nr:histidine kinase [Steroidobacter agaridevorans]GFE82111.1 ATPase [Steroidobacter agaridevorans]